MPADRSPTQEQLEHLVVQVAENSNKFKRSTDRPRLVRVQASTSGPASAAGRIEGLLDAAMKQQQQHPVGGKSSTKEEGGGYTVTGAFYRNISGSSRPEHASSNIHAAHSVGVPQEPSKFHRPVYHVDPASDVALGREAMGQGSLYASFRRSLSGSKTSQGTETGKKGGGAVGAARRTSSARMQTNKTEASTRSSTTVTKQARGAEKSGEGDASHGSDGREAAAPSEPADDREARVAEMAASVAEPAKVDTIGLLRVLDPSHMLSPVARSRIERADASLHRFHMSHAQSKPAGYHRMESKSPPPVLPAGTAPVLMRMPSQSKSQASNASPSPAPAHILPGTSAGIIGVPATTDVAVLLDAFSILFETNTALVREVDLLRSTREQYVVESCRQMEEALVAMTAERDTLVQSAGDQNKGAAAGVVDSGARDDQKHQTDEATVKLWVDQLLRAWKCEVVELVDKLKESEDARQRLSDLLNAVEDSNNDSMRHEASTAGYSSHDFAPHSTESKAKGVVERVEEVMSASEAAAYEKNNSAADKEDKSRSASPSTAGHHHHQGGTTSTSTAKVPLPLPVSETRSGSQSTATSSAAGGSSKYSTKTIEDIMREKREAAATRSATASATASGRSSLLGEEDIAAKRDALRKKEIDIAMREGRLRAKEHQLEDQIKILEEREKKLAAASPHTRRDSISEENKLSQRESSVHIREMAAEQRTKVLDAREAHFERRSSFTMRREHSGADETGDVGSSPAPDPVVKAEEQIAGDSTTHSSPTGEAGHHISHDDRKSTSPPHTKPSPPVRKGSFSSNHGGTDSLQATTASLDTTNHDDAGKSNEPSGDGDTHPRPKPSAPRSRRNSFTGSVSNASVTSTSSHRPPAPKRRPGSVSPSSGLLSPVSSPPNLSLGSQP